MYQEVELRNVRAFAYHGFYPEEQILGNEYWVSIKVRFPLGGTSEDFTDDRFVNYEILNRIIRDQMQNKQKLLEIVLENIMKAIQNAFPFLEAIRVEIRKSNPPFGGDQAEANVSLIWGPWQERF